MDFDHDDEVLKGTDVFLASDEVELPGFWREVEGDGFGGNVAAGLEAFKAGTSFFELKAVAGASI